MFAIKSEKEVKSLQKVALYNSDGSKLMANKSENTTKRLPTYLSNLPSIIH